MKRPIDTMTTAPFNTKIIGKSVLLALCFLAVASVNSTVFAQADDRVERLEAMALEMAQPDLAANSLILRDSEGGQITKREKRDTASKGVIFIGMMGAGIAGTAMMNRNTAANHTGIHPGMIVAPVIAMTLGAVIKGISKPKTESKVDRQDKKRRR